MNDPTGDCGHLKIIGSSFKLLTNMTQPLMVSMKFDSSWERLMKKLHERVIITLKRFMTTEETKKKKKTSLVVLGIINYLFLIWNWK